MFRFTPVPTTGTPGDLGYHAMAANPPAPDLEALADATNTITTSVSGSAGAIVTLVGQFAQFTATDTVTFVDPVSGAPILAPVIGVLDDSFTHTAVSGATPLANPPLGPFRDGDGLVVVVPFIPSTGPTLVRVTYGAGALTLVTPVTITP